VLCDGILSKYPIIGARKPSLVNILTELESQMHSGGSLDTVMVFLDNLRGSIDEEQIRHDQLYTD
jgi:L-lactate utilization protein LutB